ncbi:MAG: hypothetical protein K2M30_04145 [Desulfovibrionaceae bacterium]|nr:hypothetical protein [Desulfovibrionaceae bacterium]
MKRTLRHLYLLSALALVACGKAAMPGTVVENQYFTLENPKAIFFDSCIIAQVTVEGDPQAVDSISLELEPEQTLKTEYSMPFRASVSERASAAVLRNIASKPTITIQYCPKSIPRAGYRWRFRGEHHVFGSPTVYSPTYFVRTPTVK